MLKLEVSLPRLEFSLDVRDVYHALSGSWAVGCRSKVVRGWGEDASRSSSASRAQRVAWTALSSLTPCGTPSGDLLSFSLLYRRSCTAEGLGGIVTPSSLAISQAESVLLGLDKASSDWQTGSQSLQGRESVAFSHIHYGIGLRGAGPFTMTMFPGLKSLIGSQR